MRFIINSLKILLLSIYFIVYCYQSIRNDVERAVETLRELGTGCSIVRKTYVCTVPFALGDDSLEMIKVAEEVGYVSGDIMKRYRSWDYERFSEKIVYKFM